MNLLAYIPPSPKEANESTGIYMSKHNDASMCMIRSLCAVKPFDGTVDTLTLYHILPSFYSPCLEFRSISCLCVLGNLTDLRNPTLSFPPHDVQGTRLYNEITIGQLIGFSLLTIQPTQQPFNQPTHHQPTNPPSILWCLYHLCMLTDPPGPSKHMETHWVYVVGWVSWRDVHVGPRSLRRTVRL